MLSRSPRVGQGKQKRAVLFGTRCNTTTLPIGITRLQYGDGTVERHISLYAPDVELDAATARKLAADLLNAADDLDLYPTLEAP